VDHSIPAYRIESTQAVYCQAIAAQGLYANKKIGADAGFRCVGRHKRREIKIEMGRDENEKVDG